MPCLSIRVAGRAITIEMGKVSLRMWNSTVSGCDEKLLRALDTCTRRLTSPKNMEAKKEQLSRGYGRELFPVQTPPLPMSKFRLHQVSRFARSLGRRLGSNLPLIN